MTSAETAAAKTADAAQARLGTLWPADARRVTLHTLTGLAAGLGALTAIGGLIVSWAAAVWSLIEGPGGDRSLAVIYVGVAVAAPVLLLGSAQAFGALQRARFRTILDVEIPAPPRRAGRWPFRILGAPAIWRQLGYHLFSMAIAMALITLCGSAIAIALSFVPWGAVLALALLLAGPWAASGVTRLDTVVATALLGPSRTERLTQRVESLARSRAEIVAATDAERRRIERDLHDGAQQRLVSLAMNLGMARAGLAGTPGPALQAIETAHDQAVQALAELRELVRGLHPAVLNDRGLDAALSGLAARAPLPVRLRVDLAERCEPSIEAVAYFVVSEALTNVAKHAYAEHAEVAVERAGDRLRISVTDDGRGGATPTGGGLQGLTQRVSAADGTLALHSPPGGPTTITVELPCE